MSTIPRSRSLPFEKLLRIFAACAALCLAPAAGAAQEALKLGVIPYLSTRSLMSFYEPVQRALEGHLGRRVELLTAPDYLTFHQRTLAREYDIVITNPVYGRIAQKEAGYQPIARAATNLMPLLIVPVKSAVTSVAELDGKTVAITENTATITQIGQSFLRQNNVRDVKYVVTRGHTNSIAFLERGEADAAISSATALKQTAPAARAGVRVLQEIGSKVPPVMYLLAPGRLGFTAAELQGALIEFAGQTEAGKRYIEALGHEGIVAVPAREMSALDVYAEELRPQLK